MTYIKYLLPRLLTLAVLVVVSWYSLNTVIHRVLVQSWREKTGTDLEIGSVKTVLDPTQVEFDNIRIIFPNEKEKKAAEPTTLATIENVRVQFDRSELLRRRFFASETHLHNVKLDFSSLGDGSQLDMTQYWQQAQAQFAILAANAQKIPLDELMSNNLDEAAKKVAEQFEAYRCGDTLAKKWETEINSLKQRSNGIETQLKSLKNQVDTANQTPDKLAMVIGVLQNIDSLDKEIINLQNSVPQIEQKLRADKEGLIRAINNDQKKLQSFSKPKIDPTSFSEYVLGDEMREKLSGLIAWVDWGRSQVPKDDANWLEPIRFFSVKRMPGTNVTLPGTESKAEVLFGGIGIDGQMAVWGQPIYFAGGIRDYTNQPKKLTKPLVLRFCISKDMLNETLPDDYLKMLAEHEPADLFRIDPMRAGQPLRQQQAAGAQQQNGQMMLGSFGKKITNVDFFRLPKMTGDTGSGANGFAQGNGNGYGNDNGNSNTLNGGIGNTGVNEIDNQSLVLEIPTLYVTAVLDRTGDVPHDRFLITCPEYQLPQRVIGNADQLSFDVSPGVSQLRAELDFRGDAITGNLALLQSPVVIKASLPPNMRGTPIERSINTVASGLDHIQAEIAISGTRTSPSYTFYSNIGDQLTANVEPLLQQEWDQVNQKMVSLVNQKITSSSNQLDGVIAQQLQPMFNEIAGNRQQVGAAFQQNGIDVNQLMQSQMSRLSEKDQQQVQKILGNPITQALINNKLPDTSTATNTIGQTLQQNVGQKIDNKANELINKHIAPEAQESLRGLLGGLGNSLQNRTQQQQSQQPQQLQPQPLQSQPLPSQPLPNQQPANIPLYQP